MIRRLREESGQGMIAALLLLAGVLIPLMFLVGVFARIERGHLAAEGAARDAARAAAQSPNPGAARRAAAAAVGRAQGQARSPLSLSLGGRFTRGGLLRARVTTSVPIGAAPGLGDFGTITVTGVAAAPVDRYRSLREAP